MLVKDVMSCEPLAVAPEDSLLHARNLMRHAKLRHLPVLRDGRLDGVITDRDIRDYAPSRCLAAGIDASGPLERVTVDAVMSRHPTIARPGEAVEQAAARMLKYGVGCLPVVDRDRLVGMLTATDVVRMVSAIRLVS